MRKKQQETTPDDEATPPPVITGFHPFHRVIITGASSGFGKEFAMQLAPKSVIFRKRSVPTLLAETAEVWLIARNKEALAELAQEIHGIAPMLDITCLTCDLANPRQISLLENAIRRAPPARTLLINNAGLGDYGEFDSADWARIDNMLQVNINALTRLCHCIIPLLKQSGGAIANISSLASLLPIPDFAAYAASKAYVTSLSEALRMELSEFKIPVLAVCPGPSKTGFGDVARRPGFTGEMTPMKDTFSVPCAKVVADSLLAIYKGEARVYPGLKISILAWIIRQLPLRLLRRIMSSRFRKSTPAVPNGETEAEKQ